MNQVLQPHESHIPYILQFLIDHNLYGMSQLFVPSELLTYRGGAVDQLPKLTSTELEVDLSSVNILNRLLLAQQTSSGYGNPGISSIWEDEKIRRGVDSFSQLEPPASQIRGYEVVTESDQFYRDMLKCRLAQRSENESQVESRGSKPVTQEDLDGTIVDEELVMSLTQNQLNVSRKYLGVFSRKIP